MAIQRLLLFTAAVCRTVGPCSAERNCLEAGENRQSASTQNAPTARAFSELAARNQSRQLSNAVVEGLQKLNQPGFVLVFLLPSLGVIGAIAAAVIAIVAAVSSSTFTEILDNNKTFLILGFLFASLPVAIALFLIHSKYLSVNTTPRENEENLVEDENQVEEEENRGEDEVKDGGVKQENGQGEGKVEDGDENPKEVKEVEEREVEEREVEEREVEEGKNEGKPNVAKGDKRTHEEVPVDSIEKPTVKQNGDGVNLGKGTVNGSGVLTATLALVATLLVL